MPSTHQLITPIRRRFSVAFGAGFAVADEADGSFTSAGYRQRAESAPRMERPGRVGVSVAAGPGRRRCHGVGEP